MNYEGRIGRGPLIIIRYFTVSRRRYAVGIDWISALLSPSWALHYHINDRHITTLYFFENDPLIA